MLSKRLKEPNHVIPAAAGTLALAPPIDGIDAFITAPEAAAAAAVAAAGVVGVVVAAVGVVDLIEGDME